MRSLKKMMRLPLLKMLHVNAPAIDEDIGNEIVEGKGHREYVGGLWEMLGRLQFRFMVERGLRPQHVLLDIACGSLRGGVRFIPYLDQGNYLGLDIQQELIDAGIRQEIGPELYAIKRPEFVVSSAFEFDRFSKQPEFAIAQSLFTQLTVQDILLCLEKLRNKSKANTRFYATFHETAKPLENPPESHPHKSFFYTREEMIQFGDASGWATRYLGDWKHPRGQKMLEYSIKS